MNKIFLDVAKQAVEEQWDAFKIMAEMIALQKEIDAKLCETLGFKEIAESIRTQ
jgi:hypothetical protein